MPINRDKPIGHKGMGSVVRLAFSLPDNDLDHLLERARIPMSLNVAGRIFAELDSPSSTLDDIADIIRTDVGLSSKILRIANSPLFMGGGVTTVTEALVYVGLDDVVSLVAASEIVRDFEDIPFHDNPYRFWYENLYAANAGQVLARHVCLPEGRLFTACMLRSIGELVIRVGLPKEAKVIAQRQIQSGDALHIIEQQVLGFHHADLGSALLEKWHMPNSLVLPIRHYINPQETEEFRLEASVVHMANFLKNEYYGVQQPPLQNNLLREDAEENLRQLEQLKPEIDRLNDEAAKLVMG
ncbi:MAG: HDOD domain-containing protein [Gammaproteobacteria bacterium]|nr:HDOD domain-containing protein [Gammaproteobacteria bacterium]